MKYGPIQLSDLAGRHFHGIEAQLHPMLLLGPEERR
jgi:hypothetical protein